jgi:hypothetical protein
MRRFLVKAPLLVVIAGLATGAQCSASERAPEVEPAEVQLAAKPGVDAAALFTDPAGARFERVYDGGLQGGWQDFGWCDRAIKAGPASLAMTGYGGWIVARPDTVESYDLLTFELRAPPSFGDFLGVSIGSGTGENPEILVDARHRKALADGRVEVRVPFSEAVPGGTFVDRFQLRATKSVSSDRVEVDHIRLRVKAKVDAKARPAREVALQVRCGEKKPVSPLIYGVAMTLRGHDDEAAMWSLKPSTRRFGGNATSRFNWRINAWNAASDYFWMNVTPGDHFEWPQFLDDNVSHGVESAITVPMIGWVAKDAESASFSVKRDGKQQQVEGYRPDVGNGLTPDGKPIKPGPPTRTSVEMKPDDVAAWVSQMQKRDFGKKGAQLFFLDNEPMIWSTTHRDVHPEPLGYDEHLERTIAYARAVRSAAPTAKIAGPAEWGWPAYFFSGKDAAAGFPLKPDRRRHGDVPFLDWYLQQLRAHEQKTGERLLDVVDLHFYPQAAHVYGGDEKVDPATSALRIRSTRALWDPTYKDESWIDEPVMLLPRVQKIIAQSYPGRGFALGEYSFGGEGHISGALALAEALGRFGQNGLTAAWYWTSPKANSPAYWAFRAYRDYDGKGARFLDTGVGTTMGKDVSLFASIDASGRKLVVIALNLAADEDANAHVTLAGCGAAQSGRSFRLAAGDRTLAAPATAARFAGASIDDRLPAYSLTVFEVALQP